MERSCFSKLPLELRLHIYALVLKQESSVIFTSLSECAPSQYQGIAKLSTNLAIRTATPYPLALSQTCTQLQHEATEPFFLSNSFAMALPLSDPLGFARKAILECTFEQYGDDIHTFLAEVHDRICATDETGQKHVRLRLDLGVLPIRRLEFHGEHKLVARLLSRLRKRGDLYRSTTLLRPRITVSIGFSWYVAVRDALVSSQFVERRIGMEVDVEKGYESLGEAIERVKREQRGLRAMGEDVLELDGATDVDLGSGFLSKRSNGLSKGLRRRSKPSR